MLQQTLGLDRYLVWFAVFRVFVARLDRRERGLFKFIECLPEQALVLDIGANIGVTATLIKRSSVTAELYAFEPLPSNLRALRQLFRFLHVEAEVVAAAVGDSSGELEMLLPTEGGVVLHGLGHVKHPSMEGQECGSVFTVKVVRLDESRNLWNYRRVTAIKIDVENFEYFVLSGATQLLADDKPLVYCELWDNGNRQKCFELMTGMGYTVQVLSADRLVPFDSQTHEADNFFFVPKRELAMEA